MNYKIKRSIIQSINYPKTFASLRLGDVISGKVTSMKVTRRKDGDLQQYETVYVKGVRFFIIKDNIRYNFFIPLDKVEKTKEEAFNLSTRLMIAPSTLLGADGSVEGEIILTETQTDCPYKNILIAVVVLGVTYIVLKATKVI